MTLGAKLDEDSRNVNLFFSETKVHASKNAARSDTVYVLTHPFTAGVALRHLLTILVSVSEYPRVSITYVDNTGIYPWIGFFTLDRHIFPLPSRS